MSRAGRIDGSDVKRLEFLETASAVVVGGLTAYEGRVESRAEARQATSETSGARATARLWGASVAESFRGPRLMTCTA